jgi:hypothetical protein
VVFAVGFLAAVVFFGVLDAAFCEDPVFALPFDFFDMLELFAVAELAFAVFLLALDAPLVDEDFGFATVFFDAVGFAAGFFAALVFFAGFFVVFSVKPILLNGPPRFRLLA